MLSTNLPKSSNPTQASQARQPTPHTETNSSDVKPDEAPRGEPTARNKLDEISRLLRGETPPDEAPPGPGEAPPQPKPEKRKPPKSLDEAAQALGIDTATLYDLEIPLRGEGKERVSKKLGELKDYFSAQDDHSLDRLAWEETRDKEQASIARERAEIAELMAAIPRDKLNADVIEIVRRKIDANISAERRKTLDRIPEWSDDNQRTVELTGIAEHLADYGFPAVVLQGITDHRMLAYMRDNWLRMKRLQDALDKVKTVRTVQPGRGKANASAPQQVRPQRESARSLEKQVDAISKLLRG